ncbi:MAG: tRNA dihydrouridine synthase DusB [Fidelibacterota bacterium]
MSSKLTIGSLVVAPPVLLAPMAGITDYPFRLLCKEMGAGLVYSEFVSAHGIIRENRKTLDMIRFTPEERPIGIQIFGDKPQVMAQAAQHIVEQFAPDLIDINYGCPVPKVTRHGAGSAALRDLTLMEDITRVVVKAIPDVPVTVKMRSGWDKTSIVIPQAGPLLQDCGVKAITLHPRTARQGFQGQADWRLIKELKAAVSIPVIGNGDIRKPADVLRMFQETDCDAVMIGRAALGNPWFFQQAQALLKGLPLPAMPSLSNRVELCKRHLDLMREWHGERIGTNLMRKHFGWYIKGFPGAATYRQELVLAPQAKDMYALLETVKNVHL